MSAQKSTLPDHSSGRMERTYEQDSSGSFFDSMRPIMVDYTSLKSDLSTEFHLESPTFRRAIIGAQIVFGHYRKAWQASGRSDSDWNWPDESRAEELANVSRYMQQKAHQSDIAVINDFIDGRDNDDNQLEQSDHATLIGLTHALKRSFPLNQETSTIQRIMALWVSEELDFLPSSYTDIKRQALIPALRVTPFGKVS